VGSQRMVGESSAVNMTEVNKWKAEVPESLLMKCPKGNVFNMDETGLFHRLMTDKTFSSKGEKCSGGKLSKEGLTVALCAKMSGTEKMEPNISKYGKPRCFKNVTKLPCVYKLNKKALMVSDIFGMQREQRNVLLFVDNCPPHPKITGLKAINLVFTPPNTTSVLQPMDQGIIRCFKFHYRKLDLQWTIDSIEQRGKKPDEDEGDDAKVTEPPLTHYKRCPVNTPAFHRDPNLQGQRTFTAIHLCTV